MKNILTLFLTLFISFLSFTAIGQQSKNALIANEKGTLSFFLTDSENGYGVPGNLLFQGAQDHFELSTDLGGQLNYTGKPGKYEISILADGYDELKTYFSIEPGKTLNIETILEKTDRLPVSYKNYSSPIIEGYVVNPKTGKPLAEVNVKLIQEDLIATTDAKGFFTIMPTKSTSISTLEDEAVRSDLTFSKEGFISHTIESLLIIPDKIKLKIHLQPGQGANSEKYHQNILDGTENDVEMYEQANQNEKEDDDNIGLNRSACSIPSSIRVGINCNCTSCSNVSVMSLQYYSESGLDDEWISSWNIESLKAGSIPYRTYGGYYVNHPVKPNFDIASSTCNQVWGAQVYSNAQSAAQATAGKILISGSPNPVRAEYSAENNYGGTSYNCSNNYAGGSGAYACHYDNICGGNSPAGHGRGMCQWGSQRWAANSGKSHTWIINHYYVSTVGYSLCDATPPAPTSLSVGTIPPCNNGATLSWANAANNWTIQVSTSSNFSNPSSKTVSSGTSTTVPAGFSPAINWQANTTYYWRINYGSGYKVGPSFSFIKCDVTPPTTAVSVPNDWVTQDFEATFTDADEAGGSGLAKSFYQVLFFDGQAWKANPKRGFYGDNFDGTSIDTLWTSHVGSWGISTNNRLEQSDESVENSNIFASLKQDLSNRYLYVWNGKISGAGTNRRAGLHFFCSDATQYERENSYLVYFRTGGNPDPNNNNKVQLYKATGNTLTLKKSVDYTINPDQWYELSIAYDRVTGEMYVYVNGNLAAEWTDPTPIATGNSISFRNGTSNYKVDNFKVYRTRYPNVTVTVGPGTNTDIPFQNTDPSTPAAKVKSIVMDNAGNLSEIAQDFVNVDWTKPKDLIVNDGPGSDIDTVYSTTLQGNWGTAYDPHSGIAEYKVAIGTTSGNDDIVPWTSNGLSAVLSSTLTALNDNQIYYISVVAKNGAGLVDTASSDGQRYLENQLSLNENLLQAIEMYPNPTVNELLFSNLNSETEVYMYDKLGQLILKTKVNSISNKINVSNLSSASYTVMIKIGEQFIIKKFIKK